MQKNKFSVKKAPYFYRAQYQHNFLYSLYHYNTPLFTFAIHHENTNIMKIKTTNAKIEELISDNLNANKILKEGLKGDENYLGTTPEQVYGFATRKIYKKGSNAQGLTPEVLKVEIPKDIYERMKTKRKSGKGGTDEIITRDIPKEYIKRMDENRKSNWQKAEEASKQRFEEYKPQEGEMEIGERTKQVLKQDFIRNFVTSCGCKTREKISNTHLKLIPINTQFGLLTVLNKTEHKSTEGYKYTCKCECGNIIDVYANRLKRGETKSCGCASIKFNSLNLLGN